jgi:hypothetical protein
LPARLHLANRRKVGTAETFRADHRLPALLAGPVGFTQAWEIGRIRAQRPLSFGSSLLCVARADHSK